MGASDINSFYAYFKEQYSDWSIPYSEIKKSPFLMMVKHDKKGAYGLDLKVPVEISPGSGRSANFGIAQSTAGGSNSINFNVTWVNDYAVVELDNASLDFSKGDGAVVDMAEREIETKSKRLLNSLGNSLYGDGTGRAAQASTADAPGSPFITLSNKYDAIKFKSGDYIQVVAPGGTQVRTGTALISKVDRINGVLNFATAVTSSITAFAPGDYLVQYGDFGATPLKVTGLSGWLPGKSLTSTPFFGVDRTVDPTECAGFYQDFSNSSISMEEAIIEAATEVASNDGMPDYFFCHPTDWRKLQGSLSSLARADQLQIEKSGMSYGFPSLHLIAGNADVKVVADPFCPQSQGFLLTMDSWELRTQGEIGKFITHPNSQEVLRTRDGADVSEARMTYRGNLVCKTPRYNSRVYLPVPVGR